VSNSNISWTFPILQSFLNSKLRKETVIWWIIIIAWINTLNQLIKRNNSSLKNLWLKIDSYRNNYLSTRITVKNNSIQNLNSIKMHNIIRWKLIILWSTVMLAPTPIHQWATLREQDTQLWPLIEMILIVRELQGPLWIGHLDWSLIFNQETSNTKCKKILKQIKLIFNNPTIIEITSKSIKHLSQTRQMESQLPKKLWHHQSLQMMRTNK
jgi:hypothetical protein